MGGEIYANMVSYIAFYSIYGINVYWGPKPLLSPDTFLLRKFVFTSSTGEGAAAVQSTPRTILKTMSTSGPKRECSTHSLSMRSHSSANAQQSC